MTAIGNEIARIQTHAEQAHLDLADEQMEAIVLTMSDIITLATRIQEACGAVTYTEMSQEARLINRHRERTIQNQKAAERPIKGTIKRPIKDNPQGWENGG